MGGGALILAIAAYYLYFVKPAVEPAPKARDVEDTNSVVSTGSPDVASPNRVGASFTNYGSPVRAVSPQLASRTSLSPGTLQAGSGAYRRL